MAAKRLVGLVAGVALGCGMPSVASADTWSGSGTDGRESPRQQFDLERLSIKYDDSAGRVTATFKFFDDPSLPTPGQEYPEDIYLRFGLSRPGQGGCLTNPAEPDLDFRAHEIFDDYGEGESYRFSLRGSADWVEAIPSAAPSSFTYVLEARALVRAGYRCVTRIFADNDAAVENGDQIAKFCLGANDCFATSRRPTRARARRPAPRARRLGAGRPHR